MSKSYTIGGGPVPAENSEFDGASNEVEVRERYPIFRSIIFSILALLTIVIATFVIIGMNQKPEVKRRPFTPLAVMAATAAKQDVRLTVETQGEARPRTEIDLVPQVGGKIVYVSPNFVEGGIFRKGETLVRIDAADYEVAVVRAQAAVAQAEQALTREIAEGEIARTDLAELSTGQPSSLALRVPQRQQAEAALQAAKADLGAARLQLERTRVIAPFSGRVRSKNSDVGQFVTPGSRLGRVFSTDIIEVRLPLTDTDLGKLDLPLAYVAESRETAPQATLTTTIGGRPQSWTGQIMRTDAVYDTQSRALFAIVEVNDPYGAGASETGVPIAPGLFVDAQVEGRVFSNAIVIPRDGLRVENEIFVVDDKGKAEIRKVSVIDTTADRAVIGSGLAAGEMVILSPMERSRVSLPLKVLDANDPKTVLVTPPKPDWVKAKEDEAAKASEQKKKRGFFGRKKSEDGDKDVKDDEDNAEESSETEATAEASGSETP